MKGTSQSIGCRMEGMSFGPTKLNKSMHHDRCTRSGLVNTVSIVSCTILALSLSAQLSHAIFLAPKFHIPILLSHHHDSTSARYNKIITDADVAYILSINEGSGKSVSLNSKSAITVNLNRAIPQNISVILSVYSGPDLISFKPEQNSSSNFDISSSFSNATTKYTIKYAANTFGDRVVYFQTKNTPGHAEIVCKVAEQPKGNITVDDTAAYISVDIYRDWNLGVLIQIVGWIYFLAWSISFYFQFYLNYQRKSVVGLNFDFLALNLLGFTCYSVYNMSLLFSYNVQQEYYKRYTFSRIPVEYNDLFFALHASVITIFTVIQCFIYERGQQRISLPAGIFLALSSILGFGLFVASLFNGISILDVVLYLSYVKLVITTVKYVPQAYMNYKRQATTGWSIHNIMLDFTGGSFSFLQMLLLAYNYNDWISIFGNFAKFGLGLISMVFDLVFFVQHYVLYRNSQSLVADDPENSSESVPSPVISQSIWSANTSQQQQQQLADDSDDLTEHDD